MDKVLLVLRLSKRVLACGEGEGAFSFSIISFMSIGVLFDSKSRRKLVLPLFHCFLSRMGIKLLFGFHGALVF